VISGQVNQQREAIVKLALHDQRAQIYDVDVAIDTGFIGDITLPLAIIEQLQLPWLFRQRGALADGAVEVFDVYEATIEWDGRARTVDVDAVDGVPLAGMRLMEGYELHIQVRAGGSVCLEPIP
jgi:clan AA aspartic protease